ncbi:MAG TPA: KH domain-containing protein [Candidatus Saccharibacteria bacterium]|nr:KH domain-containing protein [Candidatus Saccharibacteria bacterium]
MASIDQQFIEYIVKALVGNPDAVAVERTIDEKGVLLELTVDPEDIGRVIGKRGSTAQSLRALLRALGTKNDARYNLKIVDVDRPEGERNTPRPKAETADEDEAVEKISETPVEKESDLAKKTRAELADLDDLDI